VPIDALPEVRDSVSDFGVASGLGRALDGVPILASLVDQPAAMVGQACVEKGAIKATYGTGCFVYRNTGGVAAASKHGLLSTVAWRRNGKSTYALEGGVFAAASVLTWLRDGLGIAATPAALDEMAASVADASGVVCVPAFQGLGAPHWDRSARASWLGMTLASTRAHLVRAAFEGIAHRVAEVVRAMESDSGERVERLRVDGGLTESDVLMQAEADLLGVPVEVSVEPEATTMGACYLAFTALGCWNGDEEIAARVAKRDAAARVFEPRIGDAERAERRERFTRAVDAVRSWGAA